MYAVRLWSVRHAKGLNRFYQAFEKVVVALHPLWNRIGYDKLEAPFQVLEKTTKGFLFDCQMCGQCALSSTGMSCPMNCPKELRNGPCGGVREDGFCEVKPEMRCVWVLAWEGAVRMRGGARIREVLPPVDRRLRGSSSWLRISREKAAALREARDAARTTLARAFPKARAIEPTTAPLADEPPSASNPRAHQP